MLDLRQYIKDNINEDIIDSDEDIIIDTSNHSEDRYFRKFHKTVTAKDITNTILNLKHRLIKEYYIDKTLTKENTLIIINKNTNPDFNIICSINDFHGKLYVKIITEIFKNNFKPKNDTDVIINVYV